MPYEDPLEAALRSLTDVEWRKRRDGLEARINHTHREGITEMLADHNITATSAVSELRSGRYIMLVPYTETAKILKAVKVTGAVAKPHRRKRNN